MAATAVLALSAQTVRAQDPSTAAEPVTTTAALSQDEANQTIATLREQISDVAAKVAAQNRNVAVPISVSQPMTLDEIQAQVNIIRAKKDAIAIQVREFVFAANYQRIAAAISKLSQQASAIGHDVALLKNSGQVPAAAAPAGGQNETIADQIATIKGRITSLNDRIAAMKASPAPTAVAGAPSTAGKEEVSTPAPGTCSTGSTSGECQVVPPTTSQGQANAAASMPSASASGFWQNILSFLRKVFSF